MKILKKTYEITMGVFSIILLIINIAVFFPPFLVLAIVKLFCFHQLCRQWISHTLDFLTDAWNIVNTIALEYIHKVKWNITGDFNLSKDQCYLIIANHQSWLDIIVLQKLFAFRVPSMKFFIKDNLKWIPVMGFVWWALNFPFMKRYSKTMLEKKPHLKGTDLLSTKKACQKFKNIPVSIMNFVEGTRFTEVKAKIQQTPFNNLLKPKAGGVAYVLSAMGDKINTIIDVTIVYPQKMVTLWDLLCTRFQDIRVHVNILPIPPELKGDYMQDKQFRVQFQNWLNELWYEKQLLIDKLSAEFC